MSDHTIESLNTLIYKSNLLLKSHLQLHLNEYQLTTEQWALLRCLSNHDGLNQKHLSTELFKKPAVVTRILNSLEERQWIERRTSTHDKREFLIYLTTQGRALYEKTLPSIDLYRTWLSAKLPTEDYNDLLRILNTLNHTLQKDKKD